MRQLAGSFDKLRCCRSTTWGGCRSQAEHSGSGRTDSAAAIKEEAEGSQASATAAASNSTRASASSPATTATTAGRPGSLLTLPLTLPHSPPAAADVDPPDDPGMPSPFVRWAALQRAASSGMAPTTASLDPSASGQLARGGGGSAERLRGSWALSAGSGGAATPDGSVHDSSHGSGTGSAASSVVLSPASQGLLMPRVASSGLAALDSTPTASLAAAFQAVATPPEAPAALAVGPQGSTYSRVAYASQPTIWSCSPESSAAASPPPDAAATAWLPGDTLTLLPLPPRPLLTPGPPPPTLALALRHSNSDTWEAGRLVPRSRAGREGLGTNLLGGAGGGAPPTGSAPQQLRFSVPEAIAAAIGPGRGGGGAVTTIPEASPPAVERTLPMLRLSSLQAPSLEMATAASRLDAARSVLHIL